MNLPVVLQDGEHLMLLVRRHWMFLYPRLLGIIFLALVPVGAVAGGISAFAPMDAVMQQVVTVIAIAWLVCWGISAYFTWYQYQHDVWILTNQRLIDSNRQHWFNHDLSSADLVNLQDISIYKNGVLHTMFNYGDVRCETAGSTSVFTLNEIPDPAAVLSTIDAARDTARREMYMARGN
ncbi:MAG: hypothetical protein ACKVVP_09015 [Chloroflexota bacterium]